MITRPAQRLKYFIAAFILISVFLSPSEILAQTLASTPTPPAGTNWVESPQVTEVGKHAERARQLLYWVFSHPPVNSAQILSQMWAVARNVAYAFVVITIILFAIGFLIGQRRPGMVFSGISFSGTRNIASIAIKIGLVLLWITLSYIIVLLLIQFSEILMRFFIEGVGGKNLFNIFFSGQSIEKNYTDFVGYWDINRNNWEMRNTSMFFINLTSFTYNVISVMLILRHLILWFLLIVSPFLALLMPFIFIRNTGWIWIGVFFQWLFYGPLFALFIAALTNIWQVGIPYPFDFTRRDNMVAGTEQTVYPTSINILWGGPAQTLSFNNSSNYVDTYAEYVISLIMLWTVTFLPWLLLRIFRDYCCEIMAQNQATLVQILDRVRNLGQPPPPPYVPTPTTRAGQAINLPFRRAIEQTQKSLISKMTDIGKTETYEIAQALNMRISSIQDIAEYEMSRNRQAQVQTNLNAIRNPALVQEPEMREKFSTVRNELMNRMAKGDQLAKRLVAASFGQTREVFRAVPGVRPRAVTTPQVAREVGLSEDKVKQVLTAIPSTVTPTSQIVRVAAQKTGVSQAKIAQVIARARPVVGAPLTKQMKPSVAAPVRVTVDDYEEVKNMWLTHYRESEVPVSDKIKNRGQWIDEDVKKLTNVINLLSSVDEKMKQKGLEEVETILPFLLLGGFSDIETIMYLKAKLAAAQQVKLELEAAEEAKKKVKEEMEKKEELVEVGKAVKKESEKQLRAKKTRQRELPQEKQNIEELNQNETLSSKRGAKSEMQQEDLVEVGSKEKEN